MQRHLLTSFLLACRTAGFAEAQTNSPPSSTTQPTPSVSSTNDSISPDAYSGVQGGPEQYVLVDGKNKMSYRIPGQGLRTYFGRQVHVEDGLYPSANVAAQAGAIDPAQAVAAALAGGAGPGGPPKLSSAFNASDGWPVLCPQP